MRIYTPKAGQRIHEAVKAMADLANAHGDTVEATINGVTIRVEPASDQPEKAVERAIQALHDAWRGPGTPGSEYRPPDKP